MNLNEIFDRAESYAKNQKPFTGYTLNVVQTVRQKVERGEYPDGTNIGVQIALQFDGKETPEDLTLEIDEKRLPYGASYSLDAANDCMDFYRNIMLMLFGINPGNWTQGAYGQNKDKQVPWEQRRELDLLLNKLSDRNPDATHAMMQIKQGRMLHTTSKSNPLRVEADTKYSATTRTGTGVFRILNDEQYNALIYHASGAREPTQPTEATHIVVKGDRLGAIAKKHGTSVSALVALNSIANPDIIYPGQIIRLGIETDKPAWALGRVLQYKDEWGDNYMSGADVEAAQKALKTMGYDPGPIDSEAGPRFRAAVHELQLDYPDCGTRGKPDDKLGRKSCEKLGGTWIGK